MVNNRPNAYGKWERLPLAPALYMALQFSTLKQCVKQSWWFNLPNRLIFMLR